MSSKVPDPLYEGTYFGRGDETVATAAIFDLAHDLHVASQALGRIALVRPPGTTEEQYATRAGILKLSRSLLVNERNKLLDDFARRWKQDKSTLDVEDAK